MKAKQIKNNEIHLVILDIMMPKKDGLETLEEIRKEKNIPIIMLSAKSEDIDKIMIVNGPGSFTGVRIGVTIAKVYAYLLNKDIICLSSLKILALAQKHDNILSLIDARHDNYYIGLYDKDNNEIIKEQFANKDFILKLIKEYNPICVSNKEFLIDDIEVRKVDLDIPKIVDYYKEKACENCHMVVPNYLKLPQAMEKR